ncbi:MAG TPA: SPOR domain-containing protein [Rhodobacteraceae bacterium]|nr:SPOR domain-containing protein [Paracoccaceae bacterium]
MADIEFGGMADMPQETVQSGKLTKLVNATGALVSLALIAGVAVWGYRLLVRDVTGVPVVQALEGPMRVQPDDPGGQLAANQGLAVNRVQAVGEAAPAPDRLVLAPQAAGVSADDPAGLIRPVPRQQATPATEAPDAEVAAASEPEIAAPALLTEVLPKPALPEPVSDGAGVEVARATPADTAMSATDAAVAEALALADKIAEGAEPLSTGTQPDDAAKVAVIPASVPGVSRSPRPLVRPVGLRVASVAATEPVEVAAKQAVSAAAKDVDPGSIPAGTRLAQLGAFDSPEVAKKEWEKLYGRFSEYMEGKSRVIQKATTGGRTFYRLRAMGFDDLSDARRFCSALLAEGAACIPVKVR